MLKGWKNNPEWVRVHREKQRERYERLARLATLREQKEFLKEMRGHQLVSLAETIEQEATK